MRTFVDFLSVAPLVEGLLESQLLRCLQAWRGKGRVKTVACLCKFCRKKGKKTYCSVYREIRCCYALVNGCKNIFRLCRHN